MKRTKLSLSLMRNTLFAAGLLLALGAHAQVHTIRGTVSDEKGVPLIGATVLVLDTERGTVTDFEGNFSINAETGEVIRFSYTGLESKTVTVDSDAEQQIVNETSTERLDEVVVVDDQPDCISCRIEVLKDASATAIYGARAANGVLLISVHS